MRKIFMAATWMLAPVMAVAAAGRESITVQVFNYAGAPASEVRQAKSEAGWIFRRAGIDITWVDCPPIVRERGADQVCKEPADPHLFVLAINPVCPPEQHDNALGFAVLPGRTNHAAVCYPRIAAFAEEQEFRAGLLAGVMAHELAHLLLCSAAHGEGLMQPQWTAVEVHAMAQRRLTFTPAQSHTLRRMVASRHTREFAKQTGPQGSVE
jgi:hypothetical protein